MLCLAFALASSAITGFEPPRSWAVGFADPPKIPLVADVDGDGTPDLIAVNPDGDGSIDVNLTRDGMKAGGGFQALDHFGKDCQAATVLEVQGKASVLGLFAGQKLRIAADYHDGKFNQNAAWAELPEPLAAPAISILNRGSVVLAFSTRSGDGYQIDAATKRLSPIKVPRGVTWIGHNGVRPLCQIANGDIYWLQRSLTLSSKLGHEAPNSRPAVDEDLVAWDGHCRVDRETLSADLPSPSTRFVAYSSGKPEIFHFLTGNQYERGGQTLVQRIVLMGDAQEDSANPTSESYNRDSANDGLLDGWKLHGFRGLDLKALGCSPTHADVICLVSRFDGVDKTRFESEMAHVIQFYGSLDVQNPDGTKGIHFHPVYLAPVTGADKNNPWWVNRDKFLPEKWRGVVHWMQVTPGGGGQADELSNGGTCGEGAMWAVFSHEFGHQLGLNHEGFWPVGACPIYTSLMNYTWSYSFEGDRNKIHFSDGRLSKIVLHENDLDETLPFPFEQVKFLADTPYHFRMKPNGPTTLIDWNWNGVFGEKHVKANITYAYSISAGTRDNAGKTKTAPWLFAYKSRAYALFGTNDLSVDPKTDPTLSAANPGRLVLKRYEKDDKWSAEFVIESGGVIGDPVATGVGDEIVACYPTSAGVVMRRLRFEGDRLTMTAPQVVATKSTLVPTVGSGYLFLWDPDSHRVEYRKLLDGGPQTLNVQSTNPVGVCRDDKTGEILVGLAQDQDPKRPNRWQIGRYREGSQGTLAPAGGPEWVEGAEGGARGTGRLTLLFDSGRDAGPKGRIYLFGKDMTDAKNPWACSYVAQQIADRTYHGGWLVKRYYDEWSQTRSAPAATWFKGDILFAYRWVDGGQGETDNNLHVGHHGLGIESGPMSDFDDLGYIRNFGLANSILNLGKG